MRKFLAAAFTLTFVLACESGDLTRSAAGSLNGLSQEAPETEESGPMSIFGGEVAGAHQFPFLAAIVYANATGNNFYDQFCGGTLVHARYVLTASHCVEGLVPADINILLGTNKLNKKAGQRFPVSAIHMHSKYNTETLNNDIALVELAKPAIGYATIPIGSVGADGSTLTIAGWGAIDYVYNADGSIAVDEDGYEQQIYPKKLHKADVQVISRATCNKPGWLNGEVTDKMFCAGYKEGGVDTCQGDSGGPALRLVNGSYQVVGITSWGLGCALPKAPGVYTVVDKFKPFLKAIIGSNI